jgi:hypothetical protein
MTEIEIPKGLLIIEVGNLVLGTWRGMPAVPCVRCQEPTTARWSNPIGKTLVPIHVECCRQTVRELKEAKSDD